METSRVFKGISSSICTPTEFQLLLPSYKSDVGNVLIGPICSADTGVQVREDLEDGVGCLRWGVVGWSWRSCF